MSKNAFHLLRERCLAQATREFNARGKSVQRCEGCLLATYNCICAFRPVRSSRAEFVLVMHKNETFKPTNTGRLIADVFPAHTHAFRWTRTEPDAELIELLQDPRRQCLLVFPVDTSEANTKPRKLYTEVPTDKIPTFILLDGTWKQSGRMFHLSRWLDQVPCIALPEAGERGYAVRKSHQDDYLSTAEAAALCLQLVDEPENSETLLDYFQLFNEHYVATRGCYPVEPGELHKKLQEN